MAKPKSIVDRRSMDKNCRDYRLTLTKSTDAPIIEKLASVESMQGYIKSLILRDLGIEEKQPPVIPDNLIPISQYAKEHGINRTTMAIRCKNGQYETAQQIDGKWYIDPCED